MKELKVLDEKWDYLIVLDACRFDTFKVINAIPGVLESRRSVGSCTEQWFKNNFVGRDCSDIVYISGNPWVSHWKINAKFGVDSPFHELVEVWHWAWDCNRNAVPPEPVTRAAIHAIEEHFDKRIIIHYLQPHSPFLASDITAGRGSLRDYLQWKNKRFLTQKELSELDGMVWNYVGDKVTVEDVRKGYVANLCYVLEDIEKLLKHIPKDKKVMITSDHGEMLGFPGESFGHGLNRKEKALLEIPWFEVNYNL